MSNQVSSFPATANPAPLRRHGGKLPSTSELAVHPLGDAYFVEGNGTVQRLPGWPKGPPILLHIVGNPTFVNSSNLLMPGGQDYTLSPGDTAWLLPLGDGVWRVISIDPAAAVQGLAGWTNRRKAVTAAYSLDRSDDGATVALGGSAFYPVLLPNPSGFVSSHKTVFLNEDVGRAKQILPFWASSATSITIGTGNKAFAVPAGLTTGSFARFRAYSSANSANFVSGLASLSGATLTITVDTVGGSGTITDWQIAPEYMLWPGQSDTFFISNGVWRYNKRRWKCPIGTTVNIDIINGKDSNDGLSTGPGGAIKTPAQACRYTVKDEFDITGTSFFSSSIPNGLASVIFQLADNATGGVATGGASYSGFHVAYAPAGGEGRATFLIRGNITTPSNVVIADGGSAGVGGYGAGINIELDSLQIGQTGSANSPKAAGGLEASDGAIIRLERGVIIGDCAGAQTLASTGGKIIADSAVSFVGGGSYLAFTQDSGSQVSLANQTVSFSNAPAYAQQTLSAFEMSQINVGGTNWVNAGTVTGQKYFERNLSLIITGTGNGTVIPGNSAGITDGTGKVG